MYDYAQYVERFVRGFRDAQEIRGIVGAKANLPALAENARLVVMLSPHPDDECITGALPLRLRRESRMRVINIPITLGSDVRRRKFRLLELKEASAYLGFDLRFEEQLIAASDEEIANWLAQLFIEQLPAVLVFPHDKDWHPTHLRTNRLAMEALKRTGAYFSCSIVETEYWHAMSEPPPNLVVESLPADVADLVTALSFHRGEVDRNPYHLRLPAWMMDNARRAELLTGKGKAVPDFVFATLYRLRRWQSGKFSALASAGSSILGAHEDAASVVQP
jgi:N-acetylglucosamine malate deacetylase 1